MYSVNASREASFRRFFAYLLIFSSFAVALWKCQFGVDFTDEALYLVPAWKTYLLGDKPFADEILFGLRHSDVLNHFLLRPFLPYSVLLIRLSAVFVTGGLLFTLLLLSFSSSLGIAAGLLFVVCILYNPLLLPSWSYLWWARDLVLLHQILLLLALRKQKERTKTVCFSLAGICLGLLAIAYHPTVLVMIGMPLLFAGTFLFLHPKEKGPWKKFILCYGLATLIPPLTEAILLWANGLFPAYLKSIHFLSAQDTYSGIRPLSRFNEIFKSLFWPLPFWLLLLTYLGLVRRQPYRRWLIFLCLLLLIRFSLKVHNFTSLNNGFLALGVFSAVGLPLWTFANRNPIYLLLAACAFGVGFGIGMTSTSTYMGFTFVVPALAIPLLGLEFKFLGAFAKQTLGQKFGYAIVTIFLLLMAIESFHFATNYTYFDLPPKECQTRLETPPLKGLLTSKRKQELVEKLASLVKGKKFILAYPWIGGAFYFSEVRSSLNTIFSDPASPPDVDRESLRYLVREKRFPELIIRANQTPYSWGHPYIPPWSGVTDAPIVFPQEYVLNQFFDCVRGREILALPEFSAFEVIAAKIRPCISKITKDESPSIRR